ncbi:MAG: ligase-associated DNA damage response endonuclease PdeM [Janthinobacterium lividum]
MLIEMAGEQVILLAQRALYWPARQMLMVADIHFGKAAAFRAQGIPVPRGTTTQNLEVLDSMLAAYPVTQLVFLGDFLHAKASRASATMNVLLAWRKHHAGLQLTLVRGNHDQHAGDPAPELGIHMVDEPHRVGPFALCHHPDRKADGFVIAGHVHPVYRLADGVDSLRLPCFVVTPTVCTVPAFGSFTGGFAISQADNQTIYLVAQDTVFALPPPAARSRYRR